MAETFTSVYRQNPRAGDLTKIAAKADMRDPWDTAMRIEDARWEHHYLVRSAGPDKRFDTADDFSAWLEVRTRKIAGPPVSGEMAIDLEIEHDRGPFNGRAEVAGSVKDSTGAAVAGATITARDAATGTTRTATTNAAGQFTLAGLAGGGAPRRGASPGFKTASRPVSLKVRDRAVLSAVLDRKSVV